MYKKKIKVLFVILNLFKIGGAERVVIDQINNLDKNIFDCFLCNLGGKEERLLTELVNIDLARTKKFNFKSLFDLYSWIDYISWLKKEKFDIVYSHLFFANFVGRIAGKIAGVKRIITAEHNVYMDRSFIQRMVNFFLSFMTYKIIAVSGSVKNYLIKKELIDSSKIDVIYNGVDLERYVFNRQSREEVRRRFNLTNEDKIVISIGRVTEQKGYDLLVATANEIINIKNFPVYFWIVGFDDNDVGRKLKNDLKKLNLSKYVIFLGVRTEIPDLLSAADIFFMPSKWEGFGLVLVEAMANGKPVVVSNIDTLREVLGDKDCGLLGDGIEDFSNDIARVFSEPDLYSNLKNKSLQRSSVFSIKKNVGELSKLFLE